jgi:uncharacterized protein (TIGR00375 family)
MPVFNADLHIHSPYSIAVSQKMNLETINETATKKGLQILSTGDITQPQWRSVLQDNLHYSDGIYSYKNLFFIIGTELEDNDSIHHLVLLPDFRAAEVLQEILTPFVKNITGRWAGRPHVNKSPAEIVESIEDVGGLCGPAHAFTPFKALFRQGKYATLKDAYGTAAKKLAFLELGLSANTNMADRLECLQNVTFLSNSDAHSESPQSLGREFNRFQIEAPSFEEIKKALFLRQNRKLQLNVGLDPRLGKYHTMFCRKCRRRVLQKVYPSSSSSQASKNPDNFLRSKWTPKKIDPEFIVYEFSSLKTQHDFLKECGQNVVTCPACAREMKNKLINAKTRRKTIPKLKLGVSERINEIATWESPLHPDSRPPYLNIIPLMEILRGIKGVKNVHAKSVINAYRDVTSQLGTEFEILVDLPLPELASYQDGRLGNIIRAFREQTIQFTPGGGGKFGEIQIRP